MSRSDVALKRSRPTFTTDDYMEEQDYEDLKSYMDLGIPDEMLQSFFSRFPISALRNKEQTHFDRKIFFKYQFRGQTYLATVYNYITSNDDFTLNRQLTIKLSNDGFRYHERSNVSQHNRDNWFVLGSDILDEMKHLKRLKEGMNAKIGVFYNIDFKRIDIKFFEGEKESPVLLVTFEPGYPVYDLEHSLKF